MSEPKENQNGTVHIYALRDPRDQAVRYVGATRNADERLRRHLRDRKRQVFRVWIAELIALSLKPIIEIVEDANESNWAAREKHWVRLFESQGASLLNDRDGGGGHGPIYGLEFSDSHRDNLSKALTGHSVSDETRKRISETKASRTYDYPKGIAKGATLINKHKTHCIRGHEFTPENTAISPSGKRRCRTCNSQWQRERRAKLQTNEIRRRTKAAAHKMAA